LVVPSVTLGGDRLSFEQLAPDDEVLRKVAEALDRCRLIGARVLVQPALYRGVTVVARLRARRGTAVARLHEEALDALYAYLDPLVGGPEGAGWPFGRSGQMRAVYGVLQGLGGT